MSNTTITIYRREDSNTTPRGFGNKPTYSIDVPMHSDADMVWIYPVVCTIPDGYSVGKAEDGASYLYNERNQYMEIVDDHGHPAIVTGVGYNKEGKSFARYLRLDK